MTIHIISNFEIVTSNGYNTTEILSSNNCIREIMVQANLVLLLYYKHTVIV